MKFVNFDHISELEVGSSLSEACHLQPKSLSFTEKEMIGKSLSVFLSFFLVCMYMSLFIQFQLMGSVLS